MSSMHACCQTHHHCLCYSSGRYPICQKGLQARPRTAIRWNATWSKGSAWLWSLIFMGSGAKGHWSQSWNCTHVTLNMIPWSALLKASTLYAGFSGAYNQSNPVLEGLIRAGFSILLSLAFSVWWDTELDSGQTRTGFAHPWLCGHGKHLKSTLRRLSL